MLTRFNAVALAAAAMLASGTQAVAHYTGEPAYRTDFYDNANHDTLIGSIFPIGCSYDEVSQANFVNYRRVGATSPYTTNELVGYCIEGAYNPV
ncbi:MAG TPA: hypothetical protein VMG08_08590 [Allosphingosinicella sp.]|nr:hypothetical protein [Allosphingosinicella sp.]